MATDLVELTTMAWSAAMNYYRYTSGSRTEESAGILPTRLSSYNTNPHMLRMYEPLPAAVEWDLATEVGDALQLTTRADREHISRILDQGNQSITHPSANQSIGRVLESMADLPTEWLDATLVDALNRAAPPVEPSDASFMDHVPAEVWVAPQTSSLAETFVPFSASEAHDELVDRTVTEHTTMAEKLHSSFDHTILNDIFVRQVTAAVLVAKSRAPQGPIGRAVKNALRALGIFESVAESISAVIRNTAFDRPTITVLIVAAAVALAVLLHNGEEIVQFGWMVTLSHSATIVDMLLQVVSRMVRQLAEQGIHAAVQFTHTCNRLATPFGRATQPAAMRMALWHYIAGTAIEPSDMLAWMSWEALRKCGHESFNCIYVRDIADATPERRNQRIALQDAAQLMGRHAVASFNSYRTMYSHAMRAIDIRSSRELPWYSRSWETLATKRTMQLLDLAHSRGEAVNRMLIFLAAINADARWNPSVCFSMICTPSVFLEFYLDNAFPRLLGKSATQVLRTSFVFAAMPLVVSFDLALDLTLVWLLADFEIASQADVLSGRLAAAGIRHSPEQTQLISACARQRVWCSSQEMLAVFMSAILLSAYGRSAYNMSDMVTWTPARLAHTLNSDTLPRVTRRTMQQLLPMFVHPDATAVSPDAVFSMIVLASKIDAQHGQQVGLIDSTQGSQTRTTAVTPVDVLVATHVVPESTGSVPWVDVHRRMQAMGIRQDLVNQMHDRLNIRLMSDAVMAISAYTVVQDTLRSVA